jgi:hypothetical protein
MLLNRAVFDEEHGLLRESVRLLRHQRLNRIFRSGRRLGSSIVLYGRRLAALACSAPKYPSSMAVSAVTSATTQLLLRSSLILASQVLQPTSQSTMTSAAAIS